ncbi:18813_t:CDS:2, partial [Dentiscutata erythropus]
HKLIPSVYAVLDIQEGKYRQAEAITYSGPTFIRICSGKHDSSTAYSHGKDFDNLMVEEKLHNFTTTDSQPKPVVVMINDSGPDENSHYRKTVQMIVNQFIKYDLDTIIMACYAPHQSASNPVERRMAPLSHDLAGIILPHNTFGSHLNAQLKTSDEELEKCNFKNLPKNPTAQMKNQQLGWKNIIKQVLLNCFFPPPLLLQQKLHSICIASMGISDNTTYFGSLLLSVLMEGKLTPPGIDLKYFTFDWYCPTINKSINEYLCSYCNRYYALKGSLKIYTKKCDEEVVQEDFYPQQVQIQENLIANRVLIVDWDIWKK